MQLALVQRRRAWRGGQRGRGEQACQPEQQHLQPKGSGQGSPRKASLTGNDHVRRLCQQYRQGSDTRHAVVHCSCLLQDNSTRNYHRSDNRDPLGCLYLGSPLRCRTLNQPKGSCCGIRFFFQAEDGIRDLTVTGVQTCALPILRFGQAASFTYSKSPGLLSIPTRGGAIQPANCEGT